MPERMSKQAEQKLLAAVNAVTGAVDGGMDPTAAIVKVAGDNRFNPETTALLVNAFNVGQTNYKQAQGESILDKQAEFPIARLEDALTQLYPAEVATPAQKSASTAVSSVYSGRPRVKTAEHARPVETLRKLSQQMKTAAAAQVTPAEPEHPTIKLSRLMTESKKLAYQVEQAKLAVTDAQSEFDHEVRKLAQYFQRPEYFRAPLEAVEHNSAMIFGHKKVSHLFGYMAAKHGLKNEKRASAGTRPSLTRFNADQEPYSFIKNALDKAGTLLQASAAYQKVAGDLSAKEAEFQDPLFESLSAREQLTHFSALDGHKLRYSEGPKTAGLLTNVMVGKSLAEGGQRFEEGAREGEQRAIDNAANELSSPDHMAELNKIRAQTLLADLMRNDPQISAAEPASVYEAYNSMAQLSPRAALQPEVVRPWLQRRLSAGGSEVFESQQLGDLEKTLAQTSGQLQLPQKQSELLNEPVSAVLQ